MKIFIVTAVSLIVFTAIGILSIGVNAMPPQEKYSEEFSFSRPTGSHNGLDVSNINGSVTIVGVDGLGEAKITGTKIVQARSIDEAKSHAGDIKIDIGESGSTLTVKTDQPNSSGGINYQVEYMIQVPKSWTVIADNVNGDVEVRDIINGLKASVTNGNLRTSGVAGNYRGEVTNGQIGGDARIPDNGVCDLNTVNGQIGGHLTIGGGVKLKATTTNGQIDLAIPRSTSASLDADVSIGTVSLKDIQLATEKRTRQGFTGETLTGMLGAGGGTIDLSVTNGDIRVSGF